jgi:hypothetical protein
VVIRLALALVVLVAAASTACGDQVPESAEDTQPRTSGAFVVSSEDATSAPVPAATATFAVATTAGSSMASSFGDGVWIVGRDIQAGTYRNTDSSQLCYWERLRGFSGEFSDIIANEASEAIQTVTIKATDVGFSSIDCGIWIRVR